MAIVITSSKLVDIQRGQHKFQESLPISHQHKNRSHNYYSCRIMNAKINGKRWNMRRSARKPPRSVLSRTSSNNKRPENNISRLRTTINLWYIVLIQWTQGEHTFTLDSHAEMIVRLHHCHGARAPLSALMSINHIVLDVLKFWKHSDIQLLYANLDSMYRTTSSPWLHRLMLFYIMLSTFI